MKQSSPGEPTGQQLKFTNEIKFSSFRRTIWTADTEIKCIRKTKLTDPYYKIWICEKIPSVLTQNNFLLSWT